MSETIRIRKKLRSITRRSDFESYIAEFILSDTEKEILRLHYLEFKDFRYIADVLGFSESTIKKKHIKILDKMK